MLLTLLEIRGEFLTEPYPVMFAVIGIAALRKTTLPFTTSAGRLLSRMLNIKNQRYELEIIKYKI